MSLRPAPLLQSERSFSVSSDNGTTTPLPVPYNDFWDINTVPNAGLTQVYQITNISEYQGRVIYVNKTQNTAGGTIRISLPGGYTFSSTGTQNYDFPDAPTQLIISISTSSVVAIQTGGSGVGPNSTLINYQVPDLNLGTGNVITTISDTNGADFVECTGAGLRVVGLSRVDIESTMDKIYFTCRQGADFILLATKVLNLGTTSAGTININPGVCNLNSSSVVIGASGGGGSTNLRSASLLASNIPSVTTANILYYNPVTKAITYGLK